ncbi:hypothetical protein LTR17_012516 [Elasticomyces elasticus]|nr:hypothetical protein LTR17_012516 [Elasticomyces elasticus]
MTCFFVLDESKTPYGNCEFSQSGEATGLLVPVNERPSDLNARGDRIKRDQVSASIVPSSHRNYLIWRGTLHNNPLAVMHLSKALAIIALTTCVSSNPLATRQTNTCPAEKKPYCCRVPPAVVGALTGYIARLASLVYPNAAPTFKLADDCE